MSHSQPGPCAGLGERQDDSQKDDKGQDEELHKDRSDDPGDTAVRGRLVDCLTGVESETSLARAAQELFGEEEDRLGRDLAELATWIHNTPHMQVTHSIQGAKY